MDDAFRFNPSMTILCYLFYFERKVISAQCLSDKFNYSTVTARSVIRNMSDRGLVRKCGKQPSTCGGRALNVYVLTDVGMSHLNSLRDRIGELQPSDVHRLTDKGVFGQLSLRSLLLLLHIDSLCLRETDVATSACLQRLVQSGYVARMSSKYSLTGLGRLVTSCFKPAVT